MGEFGLEEVLKQFLGRERADDLSPAWAGDRYAVFEDSKDKQTPLVFRFELDNASDADRFLSEYSEALKAKYDTRKEPYRQPGFFQFQTETAGVFLRCAGSECLTVEGASRETYDSITRAIGWTPAPVPAPSGPPPSVARVNLAMSKSARDLVGITSN